MATHLNTGAFARVFDMGDGTVVKAFRRLLHSRNPKTNLEDHHRITRFTWRREVEAYECLQAHPELEQFVPKYYGRVDPASLPLSQSLPKGSYLPGCGLRLERLSGEDVKVASLENGLQQRVEAVLERIGEICGKLDLWDASCFYPGSRAEFTLIDFATPEEYGELIDILNRRGALPEHTRELLRLD